MNVELINKTENAEELLIFAKKTRIVMSGKTFGEVMMLSEERKKEELDYIFGTIGSSLEFVDYVFLISGVTRAFTHQLVRHRVGVAFAQQTQRTVNMSEFNCLATGGCINNSIYSSALDNIRKSFCQLVETGVNPHDARGLLPTNIHTNISTKIF